MKKSGLQLEIELEIGIGNWNGKLEWEIEMGNWNWKLELKIKKNSTFLYTSKYYEYAVIQYKYFLN